MVRCCLPRMKKWVGRLAFSTNSIQLIFSRAGPSRLSDARSLWALTKGLSLVREWDWNLLKLCQRHTHKGALTVLYPAPDSIPNNLDRCLVQVRKVWSPIFSFFWLVLRVPLTPRSSVPLSAKALESLWFFHCKLWAVGLVVPDWLIAWRDSARLGSVSESLTKALLVWTVGIALRWRLRP